MTCARTNVYTLTARWLVSLFATPVLDKCKRRGKKRYKIYKCFSKIEDK
jgi:hypothetical protein